MKRKVILVALLGLLAAAILAVPGGLVAQLGCWGSLCQDATGQVYLSKPVTTTSLLSLSTVPGAPSTPGAHVLACTRGPVVPPGFGAVALLARPGSNPGTTKVVLIAGSGPAEVTLIDNLQGGGC